MYDGSSSPNSENQGQSSVTTEEASQSSIPSRGEHSTEELFRKFAELERQHAECENEKHLLRTELADIRSVVGHLELENICLKKENTKTIDALKVCELQKAILEGQLKGYEKLMSYAGHRENCTGTMKKWDGGDKYVLQQEVIRFRRTSGPLQRSRSERKQQMLEYPTSSSLQRELPTRMGRSRREIGRTDALSTYQEITIGKLPERKSNLLGAKAEELPVEEETVSLNAPSAPEETALKEIIPQLKAQMDHFNTKMQDTQAQVEESELKNTEKWVEMEDKMNVEVEHILEGLRRTVVHMDNMMATKDEMYKKKFSFLEKKIDVIDEKLEHLLGSKKIARSAAK